MANRFFKAGQNQYQSQFVPKQMPLDMMAQGLNNKQTQYNTTQGQIANSRAAFNERAYGTTHKAKLTEIEGQFDEFVEGSWDQDLTSPEFIREYQQFSAYFRNNKELGTIRARQANVDTLMEEKKKLQQEGKLNTARYHRVDKMLQQANSDQDNFNDVLSEAVIGDEADTRKGYEDIFNHIKASGQDSMASIKGVFYEKGWSGVSNSKLGQVASGALDQFMSTPAGRQEMMEYQYQVDKGWVDSNEINAQEFVFGRMLNVGEEFAHGNASFTGKAKAMNAAATLQADKTTAQQESIAGKFGTKSSPNKYNYDEMFGVRGKSSGKFYEMQEEISNIANQVQQLAAAQNYDPTVNGPMPQDVQQIISAAPGGNILISGERELTSDEMTKFNLYFQDKIDPLVRQKAQADYWLSKETLKAATALDNIVGKEGTTFDISREALGGQTLAQAMTKVNSSIEDRADITEDELIEFLDVVRLEANESGIFPERVSLESDHMDNGKILKGEQTTNLGEQGTMTDVSWNSVDSYLTNVTNEAKVAVDRGEMSPQDYDQLVEDSETARDYSRAFIAKTFVDREIQYAHDHKDDSAFYNSFNSIVKDDVLQADAYLTPLSKTYNVHDPISGRSVSSRSNPEYRLQAHVQQDPSKFTWTDDKGNEIDVSEMNFPTAKVTALDANNPDLYDDHQTFTVSLNQNVTTVNRAMLDEGNILGHFDEDNFDGAGDLLPETLDEDQKKYVKIVNAKQNITITGRINEPGEDATFKQAVADREYNNYELAPTTKEGKASFVRFMTYADPDLANDLELINVMKTNESYDVRRKIDLYKEGERILPEYVNFRVTKLPGEGAATGAYDIEVVNNSGDVIEKALTYDRIGKISGFITQYTAQQEELISKGYFTRGEVYQTETP